MKDKGVGKILKIYRIIYQEVFYDKKRIIQSQENCFLWKYGKSGQVNRGLSVTGDTVIAMNKS